MGKKKETPSTKTIVLTPINIREFDITLVGTSPLMVQAFTNKAKNEMMEKHLKKGKKAKEARDIMQEVKDALYYMPKGSKHKYGIPTSGIKNCAVSATRFSDGLPATRARGAFFVLDQAAGLVGLNAKEFVVDERPVNIGPFGKKTKMIRFRPRFDEWSVTFRVRYNASSISPEQILNLYQLAGFSIGLHEYRPERGGNLGQFEVEGN